MFWSGAAPLGVSPGILRVNRWHCGCSRWRRARREAQRRDAMTRSVLRILAALGLFLVTGCQPPTLQNALDGLAADSIPKRKLVGIGISVRLPDGRVFQSAAGTT